MVQDRVAQYRRWFDYEKDSHRKALASLDAISPDQRQRPQFQKAIELMGHIVAARQVWLFRFGAIPEGPARLFPSGMSLEDLRENLAKTERDWDAYLAGTKDVDLERKFEYRSIDSGWFRSGIDDILTQLFGHSLYHRGQIATLVGGMGGQVAITDFVYWSREAISAPSQTSRDS